MANYFHGSKVTKLNTSVSNPVNAGSAIPFVVGTAPVHTVSDAKINEVVQVNSYNEAAAIFGYSDNWEKYTLCEVIYAHFKLYGASPLLLVNVLDPQKHAEAASTIFQITDGRIYLPQETVRESIKISFEDEQDGTVYCEAGIDFEVFYTKDNCIAEILRGGKITEETAAVQATYTAVAPEKIDVSEIVGGQDVTTGQVTGLELIDTCFAKYRVLPDLILAPGYSGNAEVAAVMAAKTQINGMFQAQALIDVDCEAVTRYTDVLQWKEQAGIVHASQILCWPKAAVGDKLFHLSTHLAGVMANTDSEAGGVPSHSPSNRSIRADRLMLNKTQEVILDIQKANYLNANGIVTGLNFTNGFVIWGNYTACYPMNTDVKDSFIPVKRMMDWIGNSLILTYWGRVDSPLNRRLCESIADSANIWINGLTSAGHLLGGRVEILAEENTTESLMAGILRPHVFVTPPSPAQEIDWQIEYDTSYVTTALG